MRNGAPLAMLSVMAISAFAGMRHALAPRGSRATYRSMAQIKNANLDADGVFFRPDVMAIFQTQIEAGPFKGGRFVTSEQFTSMRGKVYPRRYTVRRALESGAIETVGQFQEYEDKTSAVRAAREDA